MAITYPIYLSEFFGTLRILSCNLELLSSVEVSMTGNGELLQADVGSRLWFGTVLLAPEYNRASEAVRSKINLLRGPSRTFRVSPFPVCGPKYDPTGTILGAATPRINSINANNREMSLKGLPNGYKLYGGDYLSFPYLSNPTRNAFHQIIGNVTASAGGVTPEFEVTPNIRPGAALDAEVRVVNPYFKAIMLNSSIGTQVGNRREGMSFDVKQTLR